MANIQIAILLVATLGIMSGITVVSFLPLINKQLDSPSSLANSSEFIRSTSTLYV